MDLANTYLDEMGGASPGELQTRFADEGITLGALDLEFILARHPGRFWVDHKGVWRRLIQRLPFL